jgi:imidazole glycerol-phosphate synthase subunit HisF
VLARRVIPCLDVRDGRVVKGTAFKDLKDIGDPAEFGQYYSREGADELVFYDITASHENRMASIGFVLDVAKEIDIPFCVGGGVTMVDDFKTLLSNGADKVSVNSGAVRNPDLITEAARKYGSQCVVLSIDAKKNVSGSWDVFIKGGRENTGIDAIWWAKEGVRRGAGELVINSIDTDGMRNGYDIDLLKEITDAVNVPVIASGGAGEPKHFIDAIIKADVSGVLAASVFHERSIVIRTLKERMRKEGIRVRMT